MKLNKKKILSIVGKDLQELGYSKFEDGFFGSDGLFIKKVSDGLLLTLGLIISSNYESKFTGAYYLSKTTRWGSIWGDIPNESYRRVGFFINDSEKKHLFNEDDNIDGVKDAWWDASNAESVSRFLSAIKISESRFVGQQELIHKIDKSVEGNMLIELASVVHNLVQSGVDKGGNFQYIPTKTIKDIPIEWFKAAEMAIINSRGILNVKTVKLLAADAWLISRMS
jgi:hypothetical protein